MEENSHVIMSGKGYEELLNFLSLFPYKDIAQAISAVVTDVNLQKASFDVVSKEATTDVSEPKLDIVEDVE